MSERPTDRYERLRDELHRSRAAGSAVRAELLARCLDTIDLLARPQAWRAENLSREQETLRQLSVSVEGARHHLDRGLVPAHDIPEVLETIELLRSLLPPPLSSAELDAAVEQALAESGVTERAALDAVMSVLWPRLVGRADYEDVSQRVWRRLPASSPKRSRARARRLEAMVVAARQALEPEVTKAAGAPARSLHFGSLGDSPGSLAVAFVLPRRAQVEALKASPEWSALTLRLKQRLAEAGIR